MKKCGTKENENEISGRIEICKKILADEIYD